MQGRAPEPQWWRAHGPVAGLDRYHRLDDSVTREHQVVAIRSDSMPIDAPPVNDGAHLGAGVEQEALVQS